MRATLKSEASITATMGTVLLALVPGILFMAVYMDPGVIFNIAYACSFALLIEALCLRLRKHVIIPRLKDLSAVLCAVLLAIALPPGTAWWVIAIGILFSIGIAKHAFGGLGMNPFNPAMVGYTVLLISFPIELTQWPASYSTLSGATVLDTLQSAKLLETPTHTILSGEYHNVAILNFLFFLGGLYLLYQRTIQWYIPVCVLIGLLTPSIIGYFIQGPSVGTPWLHLTQGATMLAAFFIATDPVSAATSRYGKMVYGFMIGLLTYVIRIWGHYPEGFAFAVLILNMTAPTLDYFFIKKQSKLKTA